MSQKDTTNTSLPDFSKPFTMMLIAQKGAGKSTLLNTLLTNPDLNIHKRYSKLFIFSSTFFGDPAFQFEHPPEQVFPEIADDDLEEIIELKMSEFYEDENFLIVLDDVISDVNLRRSPVLKEMVLNSRHFGTVGDDGTQYGFSFIITSQHLNSIPPYIRQNMNYIIVFRTNNDTALKVLYSEYFAGFNYKDFLKIFRYTTAKGHDFLLTNGIEYWRNFNKLKVEL